MSEAKASNPFPSRRTLRVLIVEDDPVAAELAVSVLKQAGYPLAFEIIGSPTDFEERLAHADYDAILCDHNLRTWTGMDALEILKRSGKDIPFLALTAVLGDEAAVEYVKRGATDYLLKYRLERLPIALSRALRDKANREETTKLQEQIACAKRDWELTFDSVSDPVMLVNEECRIQRANRALAELVGLESSQIIGKHCYEVLHRSDKPREDCPHQCLLKTGTEARGDLEEPWLGKIFEFTTSPLRDSSGALKGSVNVLRDITERKRAEVALRESEERYRRIVETAEEGIWMIDAENRTTFTNQKMAGLLGYTPEEMLGMSLFVFMDEEGRPIAEHLVGPRRRGISEEYDFKFRRKDGSPLWALLATSPIFDEACRYVGALAMVTDIKERKRAEEALRESEEHFRSFVENLPLGVYRTTPDGRVLMANPSLLRMLGYNSLQELASRNLEGEGFEAGYPRSAFREQIEREGEVRGLETAWKRRDGSVVFFRESARALRANDGSVLYYDGIH